MLVCLWPGFGDVILHPNGFLFANNGDGLKNYFNLGYYLKYNQGLHFTGVNYPYGEKLLYTDTQPFFALFLNFVDDYLWQIGPNSVAIVNIAILSGMILTAIVVFLILKHYQLDTAYSIIIAICITFLSPQWDRIHGHLSLSYAFVIPLIWYLLIRYETAGNQKFAWWLALSGVGLLAGGLHLYYILITSGFILAYLLVRWISLRRKKESIDYRIAGWLAGAAIIPVMTIWFLTFLSDPIHDRPSSPYGFFVYHANIPSIFLPHYSASTNFINKIIGFSFNWEGRAFIGSAALIFLLGLLVVSIRRFFKKQENSGLFSDLAGYGYSAALMLLISMCVPFEWLRFIPEWISPLKQFRALGRLSWIFYYVINVIAAISVYRIYLELKKKGINAGWRDTFLLLFIAIWVFDAGAFYINHGPTTIRPNDKLENSDQEYLSRFSRAGLTPDHFQAIFSLPLVAVRTDKMTFEKDLSGHNEAMKCAFHTGLPIVQSTASRPSLSQTFSSIQLISSPMIQKQRLKDMDERPLLMLHIINSELTPGEKSILDQGRLFWEDQYIQLLELPLTAFQDSLHLVKAKFDTLLSKDVSLAKDAFLCTPSCDGVYFNSFEESETTKPAFWGFHSLTQDAAKWVLLDTIFQVMDNPKELSFWVYIDPSFSGMPAYEYFHGSLSENLKSEGKTEMRDNPEIANGWVLIRIWLNPVSTHHQVYIYGKRTTVDNLLIRNPDQDVFITQGNNRLFNNYLVY